MMFGQITVHGFHEFAEKLIFAVLRIRVFIPDPGSEFFHPGSRVKKIPVPDPHQRT
jgi:hypothetical protein